MSLTADDVRHVADLARLELPPEELEAFARQLAAIVDYIQQLQQVNTEGVEPLAHPLPVQNVFRDDVPGQSLTPDQALSNAPRRRGDFFSVPAVLE